MNRHGLLKLIIIFMLSIICLSAFAPDTPAATPIAPTATRISPKATSSHAPTLQRTIAAPRSIKEAGNYLQGWAPGSLGLAITPDGKTAYVSFSLDDSLLVVDLATLTISDSIDVSAAGIQLSSGQTLLSPDGKKLYVSNDAVGNVMVVDTSNREVTKVLPIHPLSGVAMSLSRDGSKVYVCDNDELYIVNIADDSYQRIYIPGVLFGPIAPSLNNPNLLYSAGTLISNQGTAFQSSFFAFNVTNQTVERSMSLPSNVIQYPATPRRLVLNSNETVAYFGWSQAGSSDNCIGNLVTFDLSNFEVVAAAAADYGVSDFAVNETLGKIYVIGSWSGGGSPNKVPILEWDISMNKFVRNIPLSPSSAQSAIAIDPSNTDFLYETDADHNILRKIQISTGNEVGSLYFNKATLHPYAIIRGSNTGYVVSSSSQSIYKLDLGSGQLTGSITVPVPFAGSGFYQGKLYVSSVTDILAVNPSDGSIIQRYPIGWNIHPISFTFFGDRMAVIDYENGIVKQLVVFDARTMTLLKSIPLPNEPHGDKVVASPDSSKLYIVRGPCFGSPTVITIFNANTLEAINTIEIPPSDQRRGATGFFEGEFDEANRILYLLGFESVYKIHMDTDQLIGTLDLIDIFAAWGRNGWTPTGLAGISFSPSKDKLLIASGDAHSLYTYDIANSSWSTNITNLRGYFITDGVASLDRHYFYTANWRSDSVTMVDLATGDVIKVIDLFSVPQNVVASDGTYLDKVALTWSAVSDATSYEVWRHTSNNSGAAVKISSPDPTGTNYNDTSAAADTTYYYWVKAVNAAGASIFSASDSGFIGVVGPLITANGLVGDVNLNSGDPVMIAVQMMNIESYLGVEVDWWVVALAGSSWYYLNNSVQWTQEDNWLNWHPVNQGPLFNLSATEVLNITGLSTGSYTFWFAVDYPMDGILNIDGQILVNSVNVIVQ